MRILIIRRDNVGDLVCTTPMLRALRHKYPDAYIAMLVSSYNVDVLKSNPDLNEIFVYIKRGQDGFSAFVLALWLERIRLILKLRRKKFDVVFLANGGWRYARKLGGKRNIGFRDIFRSDRCQPDVVVPVVDPTSLHEVEKMALLAGVLDVDRAIATGSLHIYPDEAMRNGLINRLNEMGWRAELPTIAVHISQRSYLQRWPEQSFVDFLHRLTSLYPEFQFLLLWAPGSSDNAIHPGDDERASFVIQTYRGGNLYPVPTSSVSELVAACSLCDYFVGSDGGAMHIAAALNRPVMCFFGGVSNIGEWHPWNVPYRALIDASRLVSNISVERAVREFCGLFEDLGRKS